MFLPCYKYQSHTSPCFIEGGLIIKRRYKQEIPATLILITWGIESSLWILYSSFPQVISRLFFPICFPIYCFARMSFYDQIRYEEEGEARFCVQAAMWFGVFACLTVLSSLITGGLYLWKGWYPWLLLPLARLPLVYLTYRIWIRPKEQS